MSTRQEVKMSEHCPQPQAHPARCGCEEVGMKRASWTVIVPGYRPFTMAGAVCTREEALQTVRSIWPEAEVRA